MKERERERASAREMGGKPEEQEAEVRDVDIR